MSNIDNTLLFPGDVDIKKLILVSAKGVYESLLDYVVELNIHESLFSPFLTGSIVISDSRNLISDMQIIGEEILIVEFRTPGLSENVESRGTISKTFRIHALKDRQYLPDGGTQLYTLNFSSVELFADMDTPIYESFEGKPEDIILNIFDRFLSSYRNVAFLQSDSKSLEKTKLNIISRTRNKLKFVSPGWTPAECINWIASKSIPTSGGANFIFWETAHGFFFGTVNDLIKEKIIVGSYAVTDALSNSSPDNTNEKMATVKSLKIKQNFDQISNRLTGYLASRLVDVDLYNKTFDNIDYDHSLTFNKYSHMEGPKGIPLFEYSSIKQPLAYSEINFSHPKLHTDYDSNFDTTTKEVFGNKRSNLLELGNFKMEVTIHGRTDVAAGTMIHLKLPRGNSVSHNERSENTDDSLYTGYYLITSLTHKISPRKHLISMMLTKDSLSYE